MGMASFCGLRKKRYSIEYQSLPPGRAPIVLRSKTRSTSQTSTRLRSRHIADIANPTYDSRSLDDVGKAVTEREILSNHSIRRRKRSSGFKWSREDQLSVILELWSEKGDTPVWEKSEAALNWEQVPKLSPIPPTPEGKGKDIRRISLEPLDPKLTEARTPETSYFPRMSSARGRESPNHPRSIETPPTDVRYSAIADCSTANPWNSSNLSLKSIPP
jgi:hypothetical protein